MLIVNKPGSNVVLELATITAVSNGRKWAVLIVNKPGSNVVLELATITAVSKGKRRGRVDSEQTWQ